MNVAATKTPFTPAELIAALRAAYVPQLGHDPSNDVLGVLCAQVALETGNGASCICHNIGNFKAGEGPDVCSFTTTEWLGDPPAPQVMVCQFSAWPTLEAAAEAYLHALYTRWPEAWSAAVKGDAQGFAAGLRQRGYYTAPLAQYVAGVERWQAYYLKLLSAEAPSSANA